VADTIRLVVLDANVLVAALVAFAAGFVSFASPCVLPLVPGYLSFVTGLTGETLDGAGASGSGAAGSGSGSGSTQLALRTRGRLISV
jgi:cytochrome c-type biogenesis protein